MLKESVFRSEDVPAADRFEYWRDHLSRSYVPTQISSEHGPDFPATLRVLSLGDVRLWRTEHAPMTTRRTEKLIRASDPELVQVAVPLYGEQRLVQYGRTAVHTVRGLAIADTSHPHVVEAVTSGHPGPRLIAGAGLFVPRHLLPLPAAATDRLMARLADRPLSDRSGVGGLLATMLLKVSDDSGSYRPADGPRLGTVVLDLLSALLAGAAEAEDSLDPETRRRALVLRVRSFIGRHLGDPHLTPSAVAAAHHISLSHLHRLYQGQGETVAASIRRQRLERAGRDLADPAQRATPVHVIGARWGFPRAADFTRSFKGTYGVPPSEFRDGARGLIDKEMATGR